jgi:hypothetical protein
MSYPLIILGAGASRDFQYLDDISAQMGTQIRSSIPPLTSDLFDRMTQDKRLSEYPEMAGLVNTISSRLRGSEDKNFENILTEIYEEDIEKIQFLTKPLLPLLFIYRNCFATFLLGIIAPETIMEPYLKY